MKRAFLVAFLLIFTLAACDNSDEGSSEEPTTESAVTSVTATPTSSEPTSTPVRASTLPPAATLVVAGATVAPTRTSPPSITPRPSATSNLMIPVTPPSETPEPTATEVIPETENPLVIIAYDDYEIRLNLEAVISDGDAFVPESWQVTFEEEVVVLNFQTVNASTGDTQDLQADLLFTSQEGRIVVELINVHYANEPTRTYGNAVLTGMRSAMQEALDNTLIAAVGDEFGVVFSVVSFTPSENGFVVEIVVQE